MLKNVFISLGLFSLGEIDGMLDSSRLRGAVERRLPLLEQKDNAFVVNQAWSAIENTCEAIVTVRSFCASGVNIALLESALRAYGWLYNDIKYGWSSIKCKRGDTKEFTLDFLQQSVGLIKERSSSGSSDGSD
jgi:hypothetical protein